MQQRAKTSNQYVGCNTVEHFIRTYDGATMKELQFNRVASIYRNIIKSIKRTRRGYNVILANGQKVVITIQK